LIGVMIIILSAFTMDLILIFVKKIFLEDWVHSVKLQLYIIEVNKIIK
jgi:hypothetical protein